MKITFTHKGDLSKTTKFFAKLLRYDQLQHVHELAEMGLKALQEATPKDSGLTAELWGYEIKTNRKQTTVIWTNTNQNGGFPIAIMLQYGHGTGTGGYVRGVDYINPAVQPVFDYISDQVWKEVTLL